MKTHALKVWPSFYWELYSGDKTFEIRFNDRDYQKGDILILKAYDPLKKEYLDLPALKFSVPYISVFEQKSGYMVLALKRV